MANAVAALDETLSSLSVMQNWAPAAVGPIQSNSTPPSAAPHNATVRQANDTQAETTAAFEESLSSAAGRVFVAHGRDHSLKEEVARFLEHIGLAAVVLHEQASLGQTVIEKFESNTDVEYGIVLYTGCDYGGVVGSPPSPRARQNVVFEHGYLIGRLGRRNVLAIVKGTVDLPSELNGILIVSYDAFGAWRPAVAKELEHSGIQVRWSGI